MNRVPEWNAFIVCCKEPSSCEKGTPKGDRLHTFLAILYMLTWQVEGGRKLQYS